MSKKDVVESRLHHADNEIAIGSRKSKLAVFQAETVQKRLKETHPGLSFPMFVTETQGDLALSKPLYQLGAKALWTKELEILLLRGVVRLVVHSLKDMPTQLPNNVKIALILERIDPRDAVVMKEKFKYSKLSDLPDESIVGTSSIRRIAILKNKFPKLQFESIRGNINTRLSKLDAECSIYSCIVLAAAGLKRLGLTNRISEYLPETEYYYAVGQGALAVETRSNDKRVEQLLAKLYCKDTALQCIAERALMKYLEGGCAVPIGVYTFYNDNHELVLKAIVMSLDGQEYVQGEHSKLCNFEDEAVELGYYVGNKLIENGAFKILENIRANDHRATASPSSTNSNVSTPPYSLLDFPSQASMLDLSKLE